ncbi:cyanophycinase [Flavobacterium sp.]|uniref:cyanophycinase n=1 Tax=Flavobacterium sp. TaxID=239 RepID=UPI00261653DC|nr:cyanophycinase [Flavobacterium sp.]MDD3004587.1 cyanophycinase [Flavobacterium sp.]
METKGKLIIIGGAVDKGSFTEGNFDKDVAKNLNFFETGILKRLINESKHKEQSRIEILTTASKIPKEVGAEYVKALAYLGALNTGILDIDKREKATDPEILKRVQEADVIMVTGGDQLRLTSILGGTPFQDLMLHKYQNEEFIYAGTSAGAAAASNNMIYQGSSSEALLKGEVKITGGLGLIGGVVIDTHFVQRGRIGRLFQAVVSNPRILGIGLGEDTGLLITNNSQMEAIGSGLVILVDGREIKDTNLTQIELGQPISISHLVTHVLSKYDTFDIKTNKMYINSSQYANS